MKLEARIATLLLLCSFSFRETSSKSINFKSASCSKCKTPRFQGRNFYLPFCADGQKDYSDICGAICDSTSHRVSKGSCSGCEKSCSPIFFPVCSPTQNVLYANKCHAKCAGVVETVDCRGLTSILPGKSPLPIDKIPKKVKITPSSELQSLEEENSI